MTARESGRFVGYVLKYAARDVRRLRLRGIVKRSVVEATFTVRFERLPQSMRHMIAVLATIGVALPLYSALRRSPA